MPETQMDVIVIGAGPAGLTAAREGALRNLSVLLLDKMPRMALKLGITGKGRCNVCNNVDARDFVAQLCHGNKFLLSSVSRYGAGDIMSFFEEGGVELVVERGGRVFPKSSQARDVVDALTSAAKRAGCRFQHATAESVCCEDSRVTGVMLEGGHHVPCRAVIVATGGLSYPATGSTGDGYRMAQCLGHTIRPTYPSLVPLVCDDGICPKLEGLSLRNVGLHVSRLGQTIWHGTGEMLFTSDGVSGPLVLSASTRIMGDCTGLRLGIDLKPALDAGTLDTRIMRDFAASPARHLQNSLKGLLPSRMIPVVLESLQMDPHRMAGSVTVQERRRIATLLKDLPLNVVATRPMEEAVVTGGGIALDEIDPRTMQSKIISGLHFAGEILDADGPTGGYNLGIAFATGHAAGCCVLEDR